MERVHLIVRHLALLCCFVLSAGCAEKEPVRIGMVAGLSGRVADLGVSGRNGAILAIEQQNQNGGIKGRKIELLVRDDEQNPDTAKKAVAELIGQNVELIIGPMTSSMATAVLPQINASGTILLSPTVTSSSFTGKDDNFLRVCGDTRSYSEKAADFQYLNQNKRTFAAIYDLGNRAYTEVWLKEFRERFEKQGGKTVAMVSFTSGGANTFIDAIRNMRDKRPELAVVIANSVDAGVICQQIRKLAPQQTIALAEWASTERFIELAGQAAEGVYVAQFFDRQSKNPRFTAFREAYLKRFGGKEPGFAELAGYDAALVAIEGLEKRSSGESIKQTLLRIGKFSGTQHEITLDRFGDAMRPTFISVVRNGAYHNLGN